MKWFLIMWFVPVTFMGAWYGLSYHDFGYIMFSREVHDHTFELYGQILGLEPETIPPLLLKAVIFDSFIVLAIAAFRWRRAIIAWVKARYAAMTTQQSDDAYSAVPADNEESLSRAP